MLFIFDMGGVVTHDEMFEKRLESLIGMPYDKFEAICAGGCSGGVCRQDIMLRLSNGEITSKEFWKEVALRGGKVQCGTVSDPWSLVFNPVRDEGVVDIIAKLRKKYRVVCGTNTIESHYMEHIERADYALFDKVYASNRIGVSKPDTAFWQTILKAEGVKAQDAFFTDDREDNCAAASSMGIHTHRFVNAPTLLDAVQNYL